MLIHAKARFEAITNTGGEVLGLRRLTLDGLVVIDPNDLSVGSKHRVWGWAVIQQQAEERFS